MAVIERALCPVLIGREDEMTILEDSLLAALRGEGQLVVLAGDAGVGKTRLSTETADRARKMNATVLLGGCSEADLALPYLPFVEAIGNWLAGTDLGDVVEKLGPSAAELAQLFPQLGATRESPGADPSQAKLRLFEAVLAILRIAASERGLLLVVEDLHWADAATRELLDYMTRRLAGVRIMVLATFRLDEMHRKHPLVPIVQGWRRSRLAQILELEPLGADRVGEMIAAIFESHDVSSELRDFFFERSEGNPFALEEMLKEAIDRGDIYRTETRWERKEIGELGVPRSVADSILLRVERLDHEHAEVLRTASVLGPAFRYDTLVSLIGEGEAVVQAALKACVLQQLLVEEGAGRYRFRHALTREAVYEDLIGPRRQELHSGAANVLSRDPTTAAVDLARHLLAAQRWTEAVPVCLAAARDASDRRAFREAANLAELALAHIDDEVERARTLGFIGDAMANATDHAAATGVLERAIDLLERHDLAVEAAYLHLSLGRARWIQLHSEEAARHYEIARMTLEEAGPSRNLALAYIRLAGLAQFNFETENTVRFARRAIEVAEQAGDDLTRVWGYLFLGGGLFIDGRLDEGASWIQRAIDESLEFGFEDVAINAVHNATVIYHEAGLLDRAEKTMSRWSEIADHPFKTFAVPFLLGIDRLSRGYAREALSLLEECKRFATDGGWPAWQGWAGQWLAIALACNDRLDEARANLRKEFAGEEIQEVLLDVSAGLVSALGDQDLDRALRLSRMAVEHGSVTRKVGHNLLIATEALVRNGVPEEAAPFLEGDPVPNPAVNSAQLGGRGLVALEAGSIAEAVDLLSRSVSGFEEIDFLLLGWRVGLHLGRALAAAGREEEALARLQLVADQATKRGSPYFSRAAREAASSLGFHLETQEPQPAAVKGADLDPSATERIVTVMFADVRGYTALTRSSAPADMHERMTSFYRWARAEIERRGGMVDAFAGDAVMASWNTAVASLDHTANAVEAAIVLQDKAALMDLPVGVGIAVGSAIVGRMTGGQNVDVIGETTNLAARLQAQAEAGQVALSEEAFRRAQGIAERFRLVPSRREFELKGYDSKVTAFILNRA